QKKKNVYSQKQKSDITKKKNTKKKKKKKKTPAIKLTFSSHISRMPPFARNSSVSRFALIYVIIVN
ncbi:hypothetical protein HMPREF9531_02286, partial [Escherichia coli MS 45-1]